MVKYYFFKSKRVQVTTDASTQTQVKLVALPGQTTYKDRMHRNEPVNTSWFLQVDRQSRTVVCTLPIGTVFCIKLEGNERQTGLGFYSRNGVPFYRVEAHACPVTNITNYVGEFAPSSDMIAAYCEYVADENATIPGISGIDAPASEEVAPARAVVSDRVVSYGDGILSGLAGLNEDFLDAMTANVNPSSGPVRQTIAKLSKLRDIMTAGVAHFHYYKQNGDRREAYGTRCQAIITRMSSNRNERQEDGAHFVYFDIQKNDWRCFCVHDFIGLDENFIVTGADKIRALRDHAA